MLRLFKLITAVTSTILTYKKKLIMIFNLVKTMKMRIQIVSILDSQITNYLPVFINCNENILFLYLKEDS